MVCEVAERLENKGRAEGRAEGRVEGRAEGEKELVKAVQMLRANYTDEEILADGISQHTLELAKEIK